MNDDDAMAAFTEHMHRRELSKATLVNRASALAGVRQFLAVRDQTLMTATLGDLRAWMDAIEGQARRTRAVKISHLHAFYKWALDEDLLTDAPTRRLERPQLARLRPHPIPEDDLTKAIDNAPEQMRAWLCLMAYEGLRCIEVAGLQRSQVLESLPRPVIVPLGKGNKERIVPLAARTLDSLRPFLQRRGHLFKRARGGPETANRVSQETNRYLHSLGIVHTAHSLRHRFATRVQDQTGDLQTTAELLGHANVETARIYAEYTSRRAHKAISDLDAAGW